VSRFIESLIGDLVDNDMVTIKKMKKVELIKMAELLLKDNYRELHNDSIVELYELQFDTHLARY
jgi:hypothetical protein